MSIRMPKKAEYIIEQLEAAGYEAYIVGGCVRDAMLGREPEDWDITTSASPFQVKNIFPRTIDTGIQHGTVTVMLEKEGFEVTTYRIDGAYEDGRHPASVWFTRELLEDLKRRDFTINAMAYNPRTGLVDRFGGIEDLKKRIIRCVGCAEERFAEDALRILRAVRFAAQLDFKIELKTQQAVRSLAANLCKISAERIQTELTKLLVSAHPERIRDAYKLGITSAVIPEFDRLMPLDQKNKSHCYTVGEHTIFMLSQIRADKVLRWTALLHDIGKPQVHKIDEMGHDYFQGHDLTGAELAKKILKRLKFDNDTIYKVTKLIRCHAYHLRQDKRIIRRCMNEVGEDLFESLMEVMEADTLAKSDYQKAKMLNEIEGIRRLHKEILEAGDCYCLKMLAVNGKDLMAAGCKQGKQVGMILNEMLYYVLDHPEANQKEQLLDMWRKSL